ncbi:MAG: DALR anticodon-binding domain-containing protein, partial [Sphingobium sp.]
EDYGYIEQLRDDLYSTLVFLTDRLKVQQREKGVRHDLIDAVFALGGEDDLVRLLARVKALQAFVSTEDGTNLLAGYKRAANILKKEEAAGVALHSGSQAGEEDPGAGILDPDVADALRGHDAIVSLSYAQEPEESALIAALDSAEPAVDSALFAEDFAGAMTALSSLRAPIDAFFDKVTVNDPDQNKRDARIRQLTRIRAAMHKVADFSKIEG